MSQNPDTKDYVIVLSNVYCENCGKKCNTNSLYNWCKLCFRNENFINWTSENEKIDRFIQEMQSKFNDYDDKIFEWIPLTRLKR